MMDSQMKCKNNTRPSTRPTRPSTRPTAFLFYYMDFYIIITIYGKKIIINQYKYHCINLMGELGELGELFYTFLQKKNKK